jgi:hypothetical protein
MSDLRSYIEGRPPQSVLVTFDDGYRDNLTNALPLLVRYGIRATFFIATGYVGGNSSSGGIESAGSQSTPGGAIRRGAPEPFCRSDATHAQLACSLGS